MTEEHDTHVSCRRACADSLLRGRPTRLPRLAAPVVIVARACA
ncbi:hypothetical protein ACH4MW_06640 [Streptomyces luteogriseus]